MNLNFSPSGITSEIYFCFCQIKREISTMKLIKHPNVVQLYEVSLILISFFCFNCEFLKFSYMFVFLLFFCLIEIFTILLTGSWWFYFLNSCGLGLHARITSVLPRLWPVRQRYILFWNLLMEVNYSTKL